MENRELNKFFEAAKGEKDLLSPGDAEKIINQSTNNGLFSDFLRRNKMNLIVSSAAVLIVASGWFSGVFNQTAQEIKSSEKVESVEILEETKQSEVSKIENKLEELTQNNSEINNNSEDLAFAESENKTDEKSISPSSKNGRKNKNQNTNKLKVEGVNPIELSLEELKGLGIISKDGKSLEFNSEIGKDSKVKIVLKPQSYDWSFQYIEELESISPSFVTDSKGNKRISLFSDGEGFGMLESFNSGSSFGMKLENYGAPIFSGINSKNHSFFMDSMVLANIYNKNFNFDSLRNSNNIFKNNNQAFYKMVGEIVDEYRKNDPNLNKRNNSLNSEEPINSNQATTKIFTNDGKVDFESKYLNYLLYDAFTKSDISKDNLSKLFNNSDTTINISEETSEILRENIKPAIKNFIQALSNDSSGLSNSKLALMFASTFEQTFKDSISNKDLIESEEFGKEILEKLSTTNKDIQFAENKNSNDEIIELDLDSELFQDLNDSSKKVTINVDSLDSKNSQILNKIASNSASPEEVNAFLQSVFKENQNKSSGQNIQFEQNIKFVNDSNTRVFQKEMIYKYDTDSLNISEYNGADKKIIARQLNLDSLSKHSMFAKIMSGNASDEEIVDLVTKSLSNEGQEKLRSVSVDKEKIIINDNKHSHYIKSNTDDMEMEVVYEYTPNKDTNNLKFKNGISDDKPNNKRLKWVDGKLVLVNTNENPDSQYDESTNSYTVSLPNNSNTNNSPDDMELNFDKQSNVSKQKLIVDGDLEHKVYNYDNGDEKSEIQFGSKSKPEKLQFHTLPKEENSNTPDLNSSVEDFVDINEMIPVAVKFDGRNTDYILWFAPTDEFFEKLPARYKLQLAPEMDAIADGEIAVCGPAPTEEKAVMDVWRGCSGALKNLKVYPNPATSKVTAEFDLEELRSYKLTINDMNGAVVKTFSTEGIFDSFSNNSNMKIKAGKVQITGPQSIDLDLTGIESGMYYVVVETVEGEVAMQRLIVNR
jgi:hypothetical protein